MMEFLEEHYLSVGTLRISRVLKCVEILLQCVSLVIFSVEHLPYHPISTRTDLLDNLKPLDDVPLYFIVFTHYFYYYV
jgi:hypothetical protein